MRFCNLVSFRESGEIKILYMARFIGTPQEFYDLFGTSLLTNAVTEYTKEYRRMIGYCQAKGTGGIECSSEREAAHNHENGYSRKSIAMAILNKYIDDNGLVDIDIDKFLGEFYIAHKPLHRTIRILCKAHHRAFDKGKQEKRSNLNDTLYGMPKEKPISKGKYTLHFLPNEDAIINALRVSGICYIHYHLADGDIITKPWNNTRKEITKDNLRANVMGTTFLRKYRPRIEKIVVSISQNPETIF